jgi:hypothetical protein
MFYANAGVHESNTVAASTEAVPWRATLCAVFVFVLLC